MRKFFYLIEFILIKLFFFILIIIGYKNGSNLGDFIGRLFGPIFRSKKLIENNFSDIFLMEVGSLTIFTLSFIVSKNNVEVT